MLAPFTTISGARSPPMASSATTRRSLTSSPPVVRDGSRRLCRARHHLAAIVMAAGRAEVMRALHFAAIRAFDIARRLQRMVRTAHVAAGFGDFLLRNYHGISRKTPHRGESRA